MTLSSLRSQSTRWDPRTRWTGRGPWAGRLGRTRLTSWPTRVISWPTRLTSWPTRLTVTLLGAYKRWLSPLLPRSCRFAPTCSEYARIALLEHGFWRGSALGAGRILRCHPLHPGGIDLP